MDSMHKVDKGFIISVFSLLGFLLWKERRAEGTGLLEVLPEERNPEICPLQGRLR